MLDLDFEAVPPPPVVVVAVDPLLTKSHIVLFLSVSSPSPLAAPLAVPALWRALVFRAFFKASLVRAAVPFPLLLRFEGDEPSR